MSEPRCHECTFCGEDIHILQTLEADMRARGNIRLANGLKKALQNCSTLQDKLTPVNRTYLENIVKAVKSETWPPDDQTDLLADAQNVIKTVKEEPRQDIIPREVGFRGQVNAAFHINPSTESDEPELTQPTSEFRSMLEASSKGSTKHEQPHTAITKTAIMTGLLRQVDESQFPEFCDPEKCPPDFARHCRANRPENFGKPCIYLTPRNR